MRKIQEGIFWDEIPEEKETLISIALKALYHIRQKQKKAREIIAEKKKQQRMGDGSGKSPKSAARRGSNFAQIAQQESQKQN